MSFQDLSFQNLFQLAQQKYQSLNYQQAEYFYSLAYKKNPHDQMLILCYANLLKTTEKAQLAQKVLQKSIADSPVGSYKRYFELAEIYEGIKSIKTFQKGIEQAQKCLKNPFKSVVPQGQIKRDIAQGWAGVAQVCLNDLINQPQAQAKCKEAMQKGLKWDQSCLDVHVQIANYLMWVDKFDEARIRLIEIAKWVIQEREEYQQETVNTLGKYLVQVEEFKLSYQVYQKLHQKAGGQLEIVYMLAYCAFKLQRISQCEQHLEQYEQVKNTGATPSAQIQEAVMEMRTHLSKKKEEVGDTVEEQQQDWMDVQDQNFE